MLYLSLNRKALVKIDFSSIIIGIKLQHENAVFNARTLVSKYANSR